MASKVLNRGLTFATGDIRYSSTEMLCCIADTMRLATIPWCVDISGEAKLNIPGGTPQQVYNYFKNTLPRFLNNNHHTGVVPSTYSRNGTTRRYYYAEAWPNFNGVFPSASEYDMYRTWLFNTVDWARYQYYNAFNSQASKGITICNLPAEYLWGADLPNKCEDWINDFNWRQIDNNCIADFSAPFQDAGRFVGVDSLNWGPNARDTSKLQRVVYDPCPWFLSVDPIYVRKTTTGQYRVLTIPIVFSLYDFGNKAVGGVKYNYLDIGYDGQSVYSLLADTFPNYTDNIRRGLGLKAVTDTESGEITGYVAATDKCYGILSGAKRDGATAGTNVIEDNTGFYSTITRLGPTVFFPQYRPVYDTLNTYAAVWNMLFNQGNFWTWARFYYPTTYTNFKLSTEVQGSWYITGSLTGTAANTGFYAYATTYNENENVNVGTHLEVSATRNYQQWSSPSSFSWEAGTARAALDLSAYIDYDFNIGIKDIHIASQLDPVKAANFIRSWYTQTVSGAELAINPGDFEEISVDLTNPDFTASGDSLKVSQQAVYPIYEWLAADTIAQKKGKCKFGPITVAHNWEKNDTTEISWPVDCSNIHGVTNNHHAYTFITEETLSTGTVQLERSILESIGGANIFNERDDIVLSTVTLSFHKCLKVDNYTDVMKDVETARLIEAADRCYRCDNRFLNTQFQLKDNDGNVYMNAWLGNPNVSGTGTVNLSSTYTMGSFGISYKCTEVNALVSPITVNVYQNGVLIDTFTQTNLCQWTFYVNNVVKQQFLTDPWQTDDETQHFGVQGQVFGQVINDADMQTFTNITNRPLDNGSSSPWHTWWEQYDQKWPANTLEFKRRYEFTDNNILFTHWTFM